MSRREIMHTFVFIGGSADGKKMYTEVVNGAPREVWELAEEPEFRIGEPMPTGSEPLSIKKHTYVLEKFHSPSGVHSYYKHKDLTVEDVLHRLFENYVESKQ